MLYGVVLPMLGNMCEASVQLYTLKPRRPEMHPILGIASWFVLLRALCSPFCQRHCNC